MSRELRTEGRESNLRVAGRTAGLKDKIVKKSEDKKVREQKLYRSKILVHFCMKPRSLSCGLQGV
jgi:hypothetical protein